MCERAVLCVRAEVGALCERVGALHERAAALCGRDGALGALHGRSAMHDRAGERAVALHGKLVPWVPCMGGLICTRELKLSRCPE